MILRFIRRHRAARDLEVAKARVAAISHCIEINRKKHKAFRPLLGQLMQAKNDMLRAENALRGL